MFHLVYSRRRVVQVALVAAVCVGLSLVLVLFYGGAPRATASPGGPALFGEFGNAGSGFEDLVGSGEIAVSSSTGDAYVNDSESNAIEKFDAYGNYVLMFGSKVDKTKVEAVQALEGKGGTPTPTQLQEENVCTAVSKDICQMAVKGSGAGQFSGVPSAITVEESTGDVYAADIGNKDVEKFTSGGEFLYAIGGKVNKTKTQAVEAKEAKGETPTAAELQEENVCSGASVCQGGSAGTGGGYFQGWFGSKFVAQGGPEGNLYVGDVQRVEVFNAATGQWKSDIPLPSTPAESRVEDLAVASSGNVYARVYKMFGVHEFEPTGTEVASFDTASKNVIAIAVDSGHLYVLDGTGGKHVVEYEASGATIAEFGAGTLTSSASGIAVNHETDTVYSASQGEYGVVSGSVQMYGEASALEARYGAAPAVAPLVGTELVSAQPDVNGVTLQAGVNPRFNVASYYFEYGVAGQSMKRVPASPVSLGVVNGLFDLATQTVDAQPGSVYTYRVVAQDGTGSVTGPERTFTVGASSVAGPTGLPDGRVYEQVSPAFKNGNFFDPVVGFMFGLASADGNAVVYPMNGAVGTSYAGIVDGYVSRRVPGVGWTTTQATSRPFGELNIQAGPWFLQPSANFNSFLFAAYYPFVSEDKLNFPNIFVGEDPSVEPQWVTRPRIPNPYPAVGAGEHDDSNGGPYAIAGASPDLQKVFFGYAGTLVPEDASRAPNIGSANSNGTDFGAQQDRPWGFYEWNDGTLRNAGRLPDGQWSPFGAIPAGFGMASVFSRAQHFQADVADNTVAANGDRVFFVSPDPNTSTVSDPQYACSEAQPCTHEAPELYVREVLANGEAKVALVSRSELPGHEGEPAAHGPLSVPNATQDASQTFAYGAPDGSRVFFASVDRLTVSAPENGEAKEYSYDLETGSLRYLPGVHGSIAVASNDGAELLFVNTSRTPWRLELWRGSGAGSVIAVADLPKTLHGQREPGVLLGRVSATGDVFAFETNAPISGGFNNGGTTYNGESPLELYRYEVSSGDLTCISCPPKGVAPTGDAYISYNDANTDNRENDAEFFHRNGVGEGAPQSAVDTHALSADGSRIFFDTPSALVPQAVNGKRDVYEWENGKVFLISSGSAGENAYFLDSSESGGDVFFATSVGLVPGDTDDAYDVYDARIPRPGDSPIPQAVPCKGSVCQGPPSVPLLLGAPSSETFSGAGNLAPVVPTVTIKKAKSLSRAQKLAAALKTCRRKRGKEQRAVCEREARKRYRAKGSASSRGVKASNGRDR